MLLAYVAIEHDVSEFAFEVDRFDDFCEDVEHEAESGVAQHGCSILLPSIHSAFREGVSHAVPNGDLNEQIAAGLMACFEPGFFDAVGSRESLWQVRLANTSADAAGMLADLIASDGPGHNPEVVLSSSGSRL